MTSLERALLIGLYSSSRNKGIHAISLEELVHLAQTAGADIIQTELYELRTISPSTYIGKGKVENITELLKELRIETVIFDEDLSPAQANNLKDAFGMKVIDRTGLILDIFAKRARTREGKLQVEVAQLQYLLPRLVGRGSDLSQLGGGIGTRGPGESRLEMDRRKAKSRLALLQKELKGVESHRTLYRARRTQAPVPTVSLVGYTNAGKSTLMNQLTGAGVLAENKLFATLDPTTRRIRLPSGREVLLSDTVGFVRKLPHQLIKAFRATFEEVSASELLIHLIDLSHPYVAEQMKVVEEVLKELELNNKNTLRVFNKIDCIDFDIDQLPFPIEKSDIFISAEKGTGLSQLLEIIEKKLTLSHRHLRIFLPHDKGSELSKLYRTSRILVREDRAKGTYLEVEVDEKGYNQFLKFETS